VPQNAIDPRAEPPACLTLYLAFTHYIPYLHHHTAHAFSALFHFSPASLAASTPLLKENSHTLYTRCLPLLHLLAHTLPALPPVLGGWSTINILLPRHTDADNSHTFAQRHRCTFLAADVSGEPRDCLYAFHGSLRTLITYTTAALWALSACRGLRAPTPRMPAICPHRALPYPRFVNMRTRSATATALLLRTPTGLPASTSCSYHPVFLLVGT